VDDERESDTFTEDPHSGAPSQDAALGCPLVISPNQVFLSRGGSWFEAGSQPAAPWRPAAAASSSQHQQHQRHIGSASRSHPSSGLSAGALSSRVMGGGIDLAARY
jgi:hypothetical protein